MSTFSINERFNLLNDLAKMVVYDVTPSLIVTGEGGLGKTHEIKEVIDVTALQGCEYIFIKDILPLVVYTTPFTITTIN